MPTFTVLVIEDDVRIQKRIADTVNGSLERDDIEIVQTTSYHNALEALKSHPSFDLVFLDGCLDGDQPDGLSLINDIRHKHPKPKLLFAMSSADGMRKLMVERGCDRECKKNHVAGIIDITLVASASAT
jgi:CheY-like chemotaxis protein